MKNFSTFHDSDWNFYSLVQFSSKRKKKKRKEKKKKTRKKKKYRRNGRNSCWRLFALRFERIYVSKQWNVSWFPFVESKDIVVLSLWMDIIVQFYLYFHSVLQIKCFVSGCSSLWQFFEWDLQERFVRFVKRIKFPAKSGSGLSLDLFSHAAANELCSSVHLISSWVFFSISHPSQGDVRNVNWLKEIK